MNTENESRKESGIRSLDQIIGDPRRQFGTFTITIIQSHRRIIANRKSLQLRNRVNTSRREYYHEFP